MSAGRIPCAFPRPLSQPFRKAVRARRWASSLARTSRSTYGATAQDANRPGGSSRSHVPLIPSTEQGSRSGDPRRCQRAQAEPGGRLSPGPRSMTDRSAGGTSRGPGLARVPPPAARVAARWAASASASWRATSSARHGPHTDLSPAGTAIRCALISSQRSSLNFRPHRALCLPLSTAPLVLRFGAGLLGAVAPRAGRAPGGRCPPSPETPWSARAGLLVESCGEHRGPA